jgi:hypothetical protein
MATPCGIWLMKDLTALKWARGTVWRPKSNVAVKDFMRVPCLAMIVSLGNIL